MGIVVPPAPSRAEVPEVMARLDRFRAKDPADHEERSSGRVSPVLVLAVLLSALGIFLNVCALTVSCAPESQCAGLVMSICQGLA